jgi:ribose 5-phosphate isomerase A
MADEGSTLRDESKLLAARRASELIERDMVVGLGSGSTARLFIQELGDRVRQGLTIRAIASSRTSETLARSFDIPICDFVVCPQIDVAVDGADEVGPGLALIKGGGGSLLREKIVASGAARLVIVADSTKVVERLGRFPLPVEVIQMASPLVSRRLAELGIESKVRRSVDDQVFITDEGNFILDCACGSIEDPERMAASIRAIVGVVEHGLFLGMAELAIISDGTTITERSR